MLISTPTPCFFIVFFSPFHWSIVVRSSTTIQIPALVLLGVAAVTFGAWYAWQWWRRRVRLATERALHILQVHLGRMLSQSRA